MPVDRDPYFALADGTRRGILDLLWDEGPLPAGAIARRFANMSRAAVSKHLGILREAELVAVEARGRETWYAFEPERLRALHEAWFARFAPLFEDSLQTLKANAESAFAGGPLMRGVHQTSNS